MISLLLGIVPMVSVFVIPVYAKQFNIAPLSYSRILSPLSNLRMANHTGESLVESLGSPQALMETAINEAKKPGKVDRMVKGCDLFETDKTLEEVREQVECAQRILADENE
jgi:hypothetical protein